MEQILPALEGQLRRFPANAARLGREIDQLQDELDRLLP